jgi:hypothetical protein
MSNDTKHAAKPGQCKTGAKTVGIDLATGGG